MFHVSRKSESLVKPELIRDMPGVFDDDFLAQLDMIFLLAYAVGLPLFGWIGDRYNLRCTLLLCMVMAGLSCCAFGLGGFFAVASRPFFAIMWGVNGFFQAAGWPLLVAAIGRHLPRRHFGIAFGVWSANASVGNLLGANLASLTLNYLSWPWVFLFSGQCILVFAVLLFFQLRLVSADAGGEDDETVALLLTNGPTRPHPAAPVTRCPPRIPLWLRVGSAAVTYASVKFVNYSVYFWLPAFLQTLFGPSGGDELSSSYDWGGIIGGVLLGVLMDRLGRRQSSQRRRSLILGPAIVVSAGAFYLYRMSAVQSRVGNWLLLCLCGIFLNGSASVLSSVVAASLSDDGSTIATVTGIVDATGSLGAAMGQLLVPVITNQGADYDALFKYFCIFCLIGFACLTPLMIHDLRKI